MSFHGARVLSLESRRAAEMGTLIRNQGGDPFLAPSMREAPLEANQPLVDFAEDLFAEKFDMLILLTGVGFRVILAALLEKYSEDRLHDALRKLTIVARGPKPAAALRDIGTKADILVPEPNTWRELLIATEGRTEKRIAVQEYGRTNPELIDALRARGAEVTPVRVYRWMLPEDTAPLREAARKLAAAEFDAVLFTTSIQIVHLMKIAAEEGIEDPVRESLQRRAVVFSIGPTCSETLEEYGIPTDFAPSHPKMGFLVREAAENFARLQERKR